MALMEELPADVLHDLEEGPSADPAVARRSCFKPAPTNLRLVPAWATIAFQGQLWRPVKRICTHLVRSMHRYAASGFFWVSGASSGGVCTTWHRAQCRRSTSAPRPPSPWKAVSSPSSIRTATCVTWRFISPGGLAAQGADWVACAIPSFPMNYKL